MHPQSSILQLLSLLPSLLLITTVSAVPSVTDHSEASRRDGYKWSAREEHPSSKQHDAPTHVRSKSVDWLLDYFNPQTYYHQVTDIQSSLLVQIRGKIIDTVWAFFSDEQVNKLVPAKLSANSASRSTLAQYGNQLVLRFNVSTEKEAASLAEAVDILFLDLWASGEGWADIRLSKDVLPSLLGLLPFSLQHTHRALMQGNELAQAVEATYPYVTPRGINGFVPRNTILPSSPKHRLVGSNIFFNDYQPLSVISHWMELLQSLFPTHVKIITVGTTHEGREILALRLGVHPCSEKDSPKPRNTIIVSGGQHAREWISVSTVNYVAYSIITAYGKDPEITKLLEKLDLIFIPTLNPDGYVYSFDNDRLWRKNRQPTSLEFCPGVDLDRCWGFKWDGERTLHNPCSESFAGSEPFASIEAASFADWARNETEREALKIVGFLDLHSYSQEILYPYAFSCHEQPPTLEDLAEMGQGIAKAIRSTNHLSYKVMSACEGNVAANGRILPKIEGGGGSAIDWFYHELGVRKSFQIKLRDQGIYGFLLPKEDIVPTGSEILSAVEWFATQMANALSETGTEQLDHGFEHFTSDDL